MNVPFSVTRVLDLQVRWHVSPMPELFMSLPPTRNLDTFAKYNITPLLLHWMRLHFSSARKKDQSYLSITFAMYGKWSSILCSFSSSASSSFSNSPVAYNSLLTKKENIILFASCRQLHWWSQTPWAPAGFKGFMLTFSVYRKIVQWSVIMC